MSDVAPSNADEKVETPDGFVRAFRIRGGEWVATFDLDSPRHEALAGYQWSIGKTRDKAVANLLSAAKRREKRFGEDAATIRTEEEFEAQVDALYASVQAMGDTDTERLEELVRLCVEERYHDALARIINRRTNKIVGVVGRMDVPIGYCNCSSCHPGLTRDFFPSYWTRTEDEMRDRKRRHDEFLKLLKRRITAREVVRDEW